MIIKRAFASALFAILAPTGGWSQELPVVRLGLLQFGTVNWEAETILDRGFDAAHGFELEIVPYAGGDATMLALRGDAVDVTTGDWLEVSRARSDGEMLSFVPFSTAIGAIMAPCDSGITSVRDLKGKAIGVAGGPLDKSWLMFLGLAKGEYGFDLATEAEPVFGAPPLLAEKLRQGELDAALNYWHYNARLEAEGYCEVASAQDAARALGAEGDIPAVGYLFKETWADANMDLARAFVAASRDAKDVMGQSDEAWEHLRPMMNVETDAAFTTLKARFREGIPGTDTARIMKDTAAVYDYLAAEGGDQLVGSATEMAPGTFWPGAMDGS